MIKFYVHNHFNGTYTIMIVDHDLPLHAEKVNENVLFDQLEALKNEFSDTGRKISVYEN